MQNERQAPRIRIKNSIGTSRENCRSKNIRGFPLSFSQERLWFLHQFDSNHYAYNVPLAMHLTGLLNKGGLLQSLNELILQHDILRTWFTDSDGLPMQVISPKLEIALPIVNLVHLPCVERNHEVQRIITEEAQFEFDLRQCPLLRAKLLRLGEAEHIFILVLHHIIADGWSVELICRELRTRYENILRGTSSSPPSHPARYVDFVTQQRQWLRGKPAQRLLDYWKQKLAGPIPLLELPGDRPRPVNQSFQGASEPFELPESLTGALKELSHHQGTTLFMTMLSALNILFYRYSGQTDITIGVPIANRNRFNAENLIGCFVNTLVLRSDLSNDPSVHELMDHVRQVALEAFDHQDLPFEKLVKEMQPERHLGHSPLFQVMLAFQNTSIPSFELPGIICTQLKVEKKTAIFDIALFVSETEGRVSGFVEYNTDLFEASTIRLLAGSLETLLHAIAKGAQQQICDLPILTEAQRHQLLVEWNDTAKPYATDRCIHQLFEGQAERTPRAAAAVCGCDQLSYEQLNEKSNQLAHHLRKRGVGLATPVGLYLDRSLDLIVGLLGILKAGGYYVPLDPAFPVRRILDMINDANVGVVLTQETLQAGLCLKIPSPSRERAVSPPGKNGEAGECNQAEKGMLEARSGFQTEPEIRSVGVALEVVCLDKDWPLIAKELIDPICSGVSAEDMAYVIYTSGSTGRPKGIVVNHRPVINLIEWVNREFQMGPRDRILFITSVCFDLSVYDVFGILAAGGTIHIATDAQRQDPEQLLQLLCNEPITFWDSAPAALQQLLPLLASDTWDTRAGQLRLVFLSGDWIPVSLPDTLRRHFPRSRIISLGGATEATVWSNYYPIETVDPRWPSIPYGKPIQNAQYYILDDRLRPCPIGVPGNLYIGGDCLCIGYIDAVQTAERFIDNPFIENPGARLYNTGDRARYFADGNIQFLGRADHQVKVRGFRIELGEIEKALLHHSEVHEAVVLARDDRGLDRYLAAYIVPESQQSLSASTIRDFLRDRLPEYMIPTVIAFLDEFRLTPSGKVNRKALPAPDLDRVGYGLDYAAPRNPIEELMVQIWQGVLGVEGIGVRDNFFELGGHSLLAVAIVAQIRKHLGRHVSIRSLFDTPTIAALAASSESPEKETEAFLGHIPRLTRAADSTGCYRFPASSAQQRLWIIRELSSGSPFYNITYGTRLLGPLDPSALERSLKEICRRHEILRTGFEEIGGTLFQVIRPYRGHSLKTTSFEHLAVSERQEALLDYGRLQAREAFDLTLESLIRTALLRLCEDDHVLLVTVHHAIFDDRSSTVFRKELSVLYNAYVKGESPALPDLTVQYADYAAQQLTYLESPVYQRDVNYWISQLADTEPSIGLPTDRPQPRQPTYQGKTERFNLDQSLQGQLLAIAQETGTTPFILFLAAFQVILQKHTQNDDILVGSPMSVRDHDEVQDLMGVFLNTLVFRATVATEQTFTEFLGHVRQATLEAFSHRHLPFEHVVQTLQPDRPGGQHPLFQVMFVYHHESEGFDLQGLETRSIHIPHATAKFDLTLYLTRTEQGLRGAIEYSTDLFDTTTIQRLAGHLETLLHAIAEDPQQRISNLPILTKAEHQQQLVAFNSTERICPQYKCVHQMIEEQTERTPQSRAVVYGSEHLTYEQLNRKANRLAHHLRRLGVETGTTVGLCLPPCLDMTVGLLGILKAGAAYVPLDPRYPANRLHAMIRNVEPVLILSQSTLKAKTPEGIPRLFLDAATPEAGRGSDSNLLCETGPEHICYAIFTSGSTGEPKAAAVYHRGFTNLLNWYRRELAASKDDQTLIISALTFDLTQKNLFAPLITGGTLHLLPTDLYDPAIIRQTIEADRITIVNCTPSAFYPLADVATEADCLSLTTLRTVVLGGEPISLSRLGPWLENPHCRAEILNTYGPTECTDIATSFRLSDPSAFVDRTVPIGRPIDNVQTLVVDQQQRLLPIGVAGELCIGGIGVGAGYLGNPDLTASRFVRNPYGRGDHTDLYRTGDLVRLLPDGNIEFLGRKDHQVKIRGFRIELAEVSSAILALPEIRDAAVVARPDPQGEAQLVAFVVPTEPKQLDVSGFRQALEQELPRYMVPTVVVELDALPLTAHGKIDLQALPSPAESTRIEQQSRVAPRNATERSILDIWTEILGHNHIGVFDGFYELGGHSLLMVKVHSRICRLFQRDIGIRALFECPTVAGQAVALDDSDDTDKVASLLGQMLDEVESLSEEDAAAELQEAELPSSGMAVRSTSFAGHDAKADALAREESSVQIQTLAVVTANRVIGLRRNLKSYLQNSHHYGRRLEIAVFDDSHDDATRVENRQLLTQVARNYGANISYAGYEEKRLFVAKLLDHGDLPADIVNFALFDVYRTGYSPGANRNAVLLGTIGGPLLIADDDTVCRLSQAGDVQEDLTLALGCDPMEYRFFPDRKQAVQQAQYVDRDLLALHEQWLGKPVADLPAYQPHERCCPNRLAQMRERLNSNQARVEIVSNGLVGDCGWASPFLYLMVKGASLQRLVATEKTYRLACTSRGMIRSVQQPALADTSFFMSTFFSLDNRACPPPFLPAMRGQDHLFAATYWHCRSHSWFLHLPWTLNHEPVSDRQFSPGEIFRQASGYSLIELLMGLLQAAPSNPSPLSATQRLQALGTYLMDLSKLAKLEFYDCMCEQARGDKNQQLADIEKHLAAHPNAPQYWVQDLRRYQTLLRQALERADFWIPLDLKFSGSDKEPTEQVCQWIRKFGELLYWWPGIVARARVLKEGGQSLAQPI